LGMKVMLGCMIESSIGVTAAAHLAPLVDWIDLDGHLYVSNDDYEGIAYDAMGDMILPDRPGIGVVSRS
ncbi:MAG: dipeptide epimerase, partial [Verrucomicrobia bacterium]|nr:dipeptide epimerase [Verrucomicrobiota bacterium]